MARSIKSNALKTKAKPKVRAVASSLGKEKAPRKAQLKLVEVATTDAAKTAPAGAIKSSEKKVSQKLIETIEKRKKAAAGRGGAFGRPMGRRGRRPKALADYVPSHQEDEPFSYESENESLEYDTGIRVAEKKDEHGFNLDRFEEFDEELNFDW